MKTEEKNLCFQTKMDRWVGPYFILLYLTTLNTLEVCFFYILENISPKSVFRIFSLMVA